MTERTNDEQQEEAVRGSIEPVHSRSASQPTFSKSFLSPSCLTGTTLFLFLRFCALTRSRLRGYR
jgi:hypothetical protein